MSRRPLALLLTAAAMAAGLAYAAPAAQACQPEYCPQCPIPRPLGDKICPRPF